MRSELFVVERGQLTFSQLARILDALTIDTLVDIRASDEPGDFAYGVLSALCSAFGYGYLRRGDQLGRSDHGAPDHGAPVHDPAATKAALGSMAELARHGRISLLTDVDPAHLSTPAAELGLALRSVTADGAIRPYEDHLPIG